MSTVLKSVQPLPDYQLELQFQNGSMAIVNMKRRVRTLRFSRLASPELFAKVKAAGDRVEWSDDRGSISVYCTELLDLMLLE